jgi:hypothetical protein
VLGDFSATQVANRLSSSNIKCSRLSGTQENVGSFSRQSSRKTTAECLVGVVDGMREPWAKSFVVISFLAKARHTLYFCVTVAKRGQDGCCSHLDRLIPHIPSPWILSCVSVKRNFSTIYASTTCQRRKSSPSGERRSNFVFLALHLAITAALDYPYIVVSRGRGIMRQVHPLKRNQLR